jgi:hypothetical protein
MKAVTVAHLLSAAAVEPPLAGRPLQRADRMTAMAFRDLFSFLFQRSTQEERVAQYVIREHDRGRSLNEILEDKYVVNRLTSPEQRARLLDRPDVLHAVGSSMVEAAKATLT